MSCVVKPLRPHDAPVFRWPVPHGPNAGAAAEEHVRQVLPCGLAGSPSSSHSTIEGLGSHPRGAVKATRALIDLRPDELVTFVEAHRQCQGSEARRHRGRTAVLRVRHGAEAGHRCRDAESRGQGAGMTRVFVAGVGVGVAPSVKLGPSGSCDVIGAAAGRHASREPLAPLRKAFSVDGVMSAPWLWPGVLPRLMACTPHCTPVSRRTSRSPANCWARGRCPDRPATQPRVRGRLGGHALSVGVTGWRALNPVQSQHHTLLTQVGKRNAGRGR